MISSLPAYRKIIHIDMHTFSAAVEAGPYCFLNIVNPLCRSVTFPARQLPDPLI